MHTVTSKMARLASTYASHVPFPASAQTSGIVATGVVVGAMLEMDGASVSIGESTSRRKPYVELSGASCDAWVIRSCLISRFVNCNSKWWRLRYGSADLEARGVWRILPLGYVLF
ncbi:MAG TPA: hypothetical protein VK818_19370 [Methylomirabilota bacterium]|nr:hypothetical protein [Methylomirabilota bacterium]